MFCRYWGLVAVLLLFVNVGLSETAPLRVSVRGVAPYADQVARLISTPDPLHSDVALTYDQSHPDIDVSIEPHRVDMRLVILDTALGARLWDSILLETSGPKVAAEVVANVRSAATKHSRAQPGKLRYVTLAPPIDTDLGEAAAAICREALPLLEQRLTCTPEIALLDRPRLVASQAASRPSKDPTPLKSWRISLEFSRREGAVPGVNITMQLTGPDRQAKRSTFASPLSADSIGRDCCRIVLEQLLSGSAPAASGDQARNAEVVDLVQQWKKRFAQNDFAEAAEIADSAYALAPTNREVRLLRAQSLIMHGASSVCSGTYRVNAGQIDMWLRNTAAPQFPDRLDLALKLVHTGTQALLDVPPLDRRMEPELVNTFGALRQFLAMLRRARSDEQLPGPRLLVLSPDQRKQLDDINTAFRKYRLELELPPLLKHAQNDFDAYTNAVSGILMDSRFGWSTDAQQWLSEWETIIDDWGAAAARRYGGTWVRGMQNTGPASTGSKGEILWSGGAFGSPHLPAAIRETVAQMDAVRYGEIEVSALWNTKPADYERLARLLESLRQLPWADADKLCLVWRDTIANIARREEKEIAQTFRMVPPRPRPVVPVRQLTGADATVPLVGPGSAWPDSRVLFDVRSQQELPPCLACPVVDDQNRNVYVLGLEPVKGDGIRTNRSARLNLIRQPLDGGPPIAISHLAVPWGNVIFDRNRDSMAQYFADKGDAAQICGDFYVCADQRGIIVCPLNGGPIRVVNRDTCDLPEGGFQSAAVLKNTLYFAFGTPGQDDYMMARDLSTQAMQTVVSSRRAVEPVSPFDGKAPVCIRAMFADETRDRLVFLAVGEIGHRDLSGWWSYTPNTRAFARLATIDELRANSQINEVWTTRMDANTIAFGIPYCPPRLMDLTAGRTSVLRPIPTALKPNGMSDAALQTPLIVRDGYVWGRFGRYPLAAPPDGSSGLQTFVPLRFRNHPWGAWPVYLQPAGDGRVIVGDGAAMYLLRVPADPEALAMASMAPQPVHTTVEDIGDPPAGGQLPWTCVVTVFDAAREDGEISTLRCPIIRDRMVFAMAEIKRGRKWFQQLLSISLDDGTRQMLGAPRPTRGRVSRTKVERIVSNEAADAAMDDKNYYFAEDGSVYVHPLDAKAAAPVATFKFKLPLPYAQVKELAIMEGQLFAIVYNNGDNRTGHRCYLLRRDLVTGQQTDITPNLALPTTGPMSPPSDVPPLGLQGLNVDPERKQIVFFAHQHAGFTDMDGLWSCTPTGIPKRIKPLLLRHGEGRATCPCSAGTWVGSVHDNHLLAAMQKASFDIDLKTLDAKTISTGPGMPENLDPAIEGGTNQPIARELQFRGPLIWRDDWVWHGSFGRLNAATGELQKFPSLRPMEMRGYTWSARLMEQLPGSADMVVADPCAIWILKFPPARR